MSIWCQRVVTVEGKIGEPRVEFGSDTGQPPTHPPGMVYMSVDIDDLYEAMNWSETDDVLFIAVQEGKTFLLAYVAQPLSKTHSISKNIDHGVTRGSWETKYGLKSLPWEERVYIIATGTGLLTGGLTTRMQGRQRIRLETPELDRILRKIPGGLRDLRYYAPEIAKEIAELRIADRHDDATRVPRRK
tara:strand:- start:244 stop:807 length:564 start_codon:yes stop_codon:yes gene_type:complete